MKIVVLEFDSIDDILAYMEEVKSILVQYNYTYEIVDEKILILKVENLKTKIVWQQKGMCFYMN